MQKQVCLLLACSLSLAAAAQFSKAVKDSVAAQMFYPSPRYEITLGLNPADYDKAGQNAGNTRQQDSLTGNYTDAPLLAERSFTALQKEKNLEKANEYLTKAIRQYEAWINAEPANPEPITRLAVLALSSKNYQLAPKTLDYGLEQFPNHLPLLHVAAHYYTLIAGEMATAQVYINQALQLDSLNTTTLVWQTMLNKSRFLKQLQQGGAATMPADAALDRALQRQPGNAGFQHLAYFRQLLTIFFEAMMRSARAKSDNMNVFENTGITAAENSILENAKSWFQQQAARQDAIGATAMSTLGVIACLQQQYEKGADWFYKSFKAGKNSNMDQVLGSAVLCRFFLKDYEGAARLVEEKITVSGDILDYGALLRIYQRYIPDVKKQQQILKQVEALNGALPGRAAVLASGYMITGNWQQSRPLLDQLTASDLDTHIIKAGLAIMHNERDMAQTSLAKALAIDPNDATALKIKQLAGL